MSGIISGYIPRGKLGRIRGGVSGGICKEIWWEFFEKSGEGSLLNYEEGLQ